LSTSSTSSETLYHPALNFINLTNISTLKHILRGVRKRVGEEEELEARLEVRFEE